MCVCYFTLRNNVSISSVNRRLFLRPNGKWILCYHVKSGRNKELVLRNFILRDGGARRFGGPPTAAPNICRHSLSHQRNKGLRSPLGGPPSHLAFFVIRPRGLFRDKNWSWAFFEALNVSFFDPLSNAAMPVIPTTAALDRSCGPILDAKRLSGPFGGFQTK